MQARDYIASLPDGRIPPDDIIIIYIGNNDAMAGFEAIDALPDALEAVVSRLVEVGARHVLVSTIPFASTPRFYEMMETTKGQTLALSLFMANDKIRNIVFTTQGRGKRGLLLQMDQIFYEVLADVLASPPSDWAGYLQ